MNKESNGSNVYIVTFVIIIIVFFTMFILLDMANKASKKRKVVEPISTTTTAEPPIVVTNFKASLELIIDNNEFYGDYEQVVRYSGAKFIFKCTKFDPEKNICESGEAVMDTGSAKVLLFSYENDDENYLKKKDQYYVIVNDTHIILLHDRTSTRPGYATIHTRDGKEINRIENITTYYNFDKEISKGLYPNIEKNEITYYQCDNKKVKIVKKDLTTKEKEQLVENIDGALCN